MELIRGQKAKLSDLSSSLRFEVGIQLQLRGPGTIDITCFGLDAASKLSDDRYFVFFNQPSSPGNEIRKLGAGGGDAERFAIDLSPLPSTVVRLVVTAAIDGAGTMAQVTNGCLRLSSGGKEVARFSFSGTDFSAEKAVILAEIYRTDIWRIAAVGQGFNGGLSALLKNFGGEEGAASPAPPQSTPTPPAPPAPPASPVPAVPSAGNTINSSTIRIKYTDPSQDTLSLQKIASEAATIFTPNEEIYYIAMQNHLAVSTKKDAIVATSNRVILYCPDMLGRMHFTDLQWRDVKGVHLKQGMMSSEITVESITGQNSRIGALYKDQARRFYGIAQQLEQEWREKRRLREMEEARARSGGIVIGTPPLGGADAAASAEDPVARLKKAKAMLDAGLISEVEYEAVKAKVVANM